MQNERHSTIQESPANHAYFNFILCMKAILFIRQRHGLDECAKYNTEWTDYNCHICFWLEFYWNIKYTHDVAFQYDKKHEKKYKKRIAFSFSLTPYPPPSCSLASEQNLNLDIKCIITEYNKKGKKSTTSHLYE